MYQVHAVGGKLVVDSTFAPPPLQYPFKWGADIIMHSGSPQPAPEHTFSRLYSER